MAVNICIYGYVSFGNILTKAYSQQFNLAVPFYVHIIGKAQAGAVDFVKLCVIDNLLILRLHCFIFFGKCPFFRNPMEIHHEVGAGAGGGGVKIGLVKQAVYLGPSGGPCVILAGSGQGHGAVIHRGGGLALGPPKECKRLGVSAGIAGVKRRPGGNVVFISPQRGLIEPISK